MAGPTLNDLLTPGFHSSHPSTWESTKKQKNALRDFEKEYLGEFNMKMTADDEEKSLDALAVEITKYIQTKGGESFMLGEPAQLTVRKSDGSFSKRPHIGGEDFLITGVYAGKRNALIFIFKPVDVAEYTNMEMSFTDAKHYFNGFGEYIKKSMDGGLDNALKEINKGAANKAEAVKNVSKFEQYADMGFGSF